MTTDECVNCKYAIINEENKARVTVECSRREKTYLWGQYVPCEDYIEKENYDDWSNKFKDKS